MRGRFVISNDAGLEVPGAERHEAAGLVVWTEGETGFREIRDHSGVPWGVLGRPIDTAELGDATDTIAAQATDGVVERTRDWCNRWALFNSDVLITDAQGSLPVFHARDGERVIVSNSVLLLARLTGAEPERARTLNRDVFPEWIPAPLTAHRGIRHLLPSSRLHWKDGSVTPWKRYRVTSVTVSEGVDDWESRVRTAMTNTAAAFDRVLLGLSGGYDSRSILAASVATQTPLECVTLQHPQIFPYDIDLPPELARRARRPHRFVAPGPFDETRYREFVDHSGGLVAVMDDLLYARGQYELAEPGERAALMRCHGWEVGYAFYWRRLPPWEELDTERFGKFISRRWKVFGTWREMLSEELDLWFEHYLQCRTEDVDWRDAFFIDQRQCAWLGPVDEALSQLAIEIVQLGGCQALFDTHLSMPLAPRRHRVPTHQLIERLAPELSTIPYNPKTFSRFEGMGWKTKRRMRRWAARLGMLLG